MDKGVRSKIKYKYKFRNPQSIKSSNRSRRVEDISSSKRHFGSDKTKL